MTGDPKGVLVTVLAQDAAGKPQPLLVDSSGSLKVTTV